MASNPVLGPAVNQILLKSMHGITANASKVQKDMIKSLADIKNL